ncbi:blastula protease 10-like [Palaemon carinicauda]|uniref:blastula protease 10-like n=1 Tax=Palaemon carinicauda TaxID=392227 RepID=UPI0035B66DB1
MLRKAITGEGLRDKTSLLSKGTDHQRILSLTPRTDREEDDSMKEEVDEKYILENEKRKEEHGIKGNLGSEFSDNKDNNYASNKGFLKEVSEGEDWEIYSSHNRHKRDFSSNEKWAENFHNRDKYNATEINIKDSPEISMNTTIDFARWVDDMILDAERHFSSRQGPGNCQDEVGPCVTNPPVGGLEYFATPKPQNNEYFSEIMTPAVLWPFGNFTGYPLVPYRILIKDPALVKLVEEAIWEWNSATCVDFVNITDENARGLGRTDFLNILENPDRCIFRFGKMEGRPQALFLHPSCHTKEEIVRGLGIALGIHYQFLRPDRALHLNINKENVNDNFPKFGMDEFSYAKISFDYSSAMQPHSVWLSKNGKLTFSTKDIKYQGILGRSGGGISHMDKIVVNKLYGCLDRWRSLCGFRHDPCLNEGYLGQSCRCVCRRGTFGATCTNFEWRDYYGPLIPPCSKNINQETTIEAPLDERGFIQDDTWCTWHISAPEGQVINLKFDTFNLEKSSRTCERAFLEIRQKNESFGQVYCGNDISQKSEITSLDNELNLYLDVRNNNSKGFRAEVRFMASPITTSLEGTTQKPLLKPLPTSSSHSSSAFGILICTSLILSVMQFGSL